MSLQDTSGATDPGDTPVVRHHIERGDTARGADGATIGTVVQLVMDRDSGQPSAVVIHGDDSNSEFELPWSHIVDTSGNQVRLDVNSQDIASVARPYNPTQYVPLDTGQAVPPSEAGKIAQDEGRPVVTNIQPDAVELLEPQSPTDEATRPYPSVPQPGQKRATPLTPQPIPPTQPLTSRRQPTRAEQRDLKTETERDTLKPAPNTPPVETSPVTSTEGELVGGKPSTSGVGAASTVPTPGTERSTEGLDAPGQRVAGQPDAYTGPRPVADTSTTSASATPPSRFSGKVQPIGGPAWRIAQQAVESAQQTTRDMVQAAQRSTQQARQVVIIRRMRPLAIGLMAAGLGTGALIGAISAIRQRQAGRGNKLKWVGKQANKRVSGFGSLFQQTQSSVQQVAEDASRKAQDFASRAQDATSQAQVKAARASKETKKTAKRAVRRARWFRNGLLLGSVLGILFAPKPGAELRSQLASRVEQWRTKIA